MREPLNHYMKLGLVHFMAYPSAMSGEGDIEGTVKSVLEDSGFECIELTSILDSGARQRVAKMIRESGIFMTYGAQPQILRNKENLNSLDDALRLQAVDRMKHCIDEAYEMGAKGFAYLAGKFDPDQVEAHYQALIKSTRELCAYAQQKGDMPINLEVFDHDVEKCSLIGPVDRALRFVKEISAEYPFFGLMVDLSHITQLHETLEENLEPIAPYIRHVHIANAVLKKGAPAYGDQHPRFGFPDSLVDTNLLAAFLRKLFDIGYLKEGKRPVLSFEVKPWGDEDSSMVIAGAKRFLLEAWQKV